MFFVDSGSACALSLDVVHNLASNIERGRVIPEFMLDVVRDSPLRRIAISCAFASKERVRVFTNRAKIQRRRRCGRAARTAGKEKPIVAYVLGPRRIQTVIGNTRID